MPTCFVIQPFDSGKFDKRFDGVYRPAIEATGLEAYRVDHDPAVDVPIDAIEQGIRDAAVCLADITSDSPNGWYELGFAFAAGRPVVMICSNERPEKRYPFDIQHRTIIAYQPEAPSDFLRLQSTLTERIRALMNRSEALRQIAEAEQVAPSQGLSQPELIVLAVIAGDASLPGWSSSLSSVKSDCERSALTPVGFTLGIRRLLAKSFVEISDLWDEDGSQYKGATLTDKGWRFVDSNESLFVLRRKNPVDDEFRFDWATATVLLLSIDPGLTHYVYHC